jgi:hypothetical protein
MKFSSKLALVAAASFLSVSAFAQTVSTTDMSVDTLKAGIRTDMGIATLSDDGGAYIVQTSAVGGSALIQQENVAGGNWAYINQANVTAPSEAMIIQSGETGAGNVAVIIQK